MSGTDLRLPPAAGWLLRLLWPGDWTMQPLPPLGESDAGAKVRPVIRLPGDSLPAVLYLPHTALVDWPAMVAHAAAHRRFGGPPQPRRGLKPVQQALLEVLEDARVEWLACAEWPGLRSWWRPYHEGEQSRHGQGFDDLLARLSACLLDPDRLDSHPWIARVRQVFFERDGRSLALRTPQAVREAASRLGNDIGQMRLPFNARTYQVHARYRDDNHHLWLPSDEDRQALTLPDLQDLPEKLMPPLSPSPAEWFLDEPVARYPEWDYRIGCYRPDWVTVYEHHWPLDATSARKYYPDAWPLRLRQRRWRPPALGRGGGRQAEGAELHPAALIEQALALRVRRMPDERVWRKPTPRPTTQGVLLLVDASVSTAGDLDAWQSEVQQIARELQRMGHLSAVWAFGSDGRHRVRLQCIKGWQQRCEVVPWGELQAGGSTRLGAALRHAAHLCQQCLRQVDECTILLLTDGELHDIDVHDRSYLSADLVRALRELRVQGVGVHALVSGGAHQLRRALGPNGCSPMTLASREIALSRVLAGRSG